MRQNVRQIADRLGLDPFEVLCYFAKGDAEALGLPIDPGSGQTYPIPLEQRLSAAKEACKYLYPQLKAIEIKTEDSADLNRRLEAIHRLLDSATVKEDA